MREYLKWLKPENSKDAEQLFFAGIGLVALLWTYVCGRRNGSKQSKKDFLNILRVADKEVTFIDKDRRGHGFTAKYF